MMARSFMWNIRGGATLRRSMRVLTLPSILRRASKRAMSGIAGSTRFRPSARDSSMAIRASTTSMKCADADTDTNWLKSSLGTTNGAGPRLSRRTTPLISVERSSWGTRRRYPQSIGDGSTGSWSRRPTSSGDECENAKQRQQLGSVWRAQACHRIPILRRIIACANLAHVVVACGDVVEGVSIQAVSPTDEIQRRIDIAKAMMRQLIADGCEASPLWRTRARAAEEEEDGGVGGVESQ